MSGLTQPSDLKKLLRKVFEVLRPDLRQYYKLPIKARVEKIYEAGGSYWIDVQPLRNDESVDNAAPLLKKVEMPLVWAGDNRGVFCLPQPGTTVVAGFFDGDPNYPYIAAIRSFGLKSPTHPLGAFIIQQGADTYFKIDPVKNIISVTPANLQNDVGTDKTEDIGGNWTIQVGGATTVEAAESITVRAPQINIVGDVSSTGIGGGIGTEIKAADTEQTGNFTLLGNFTVSGSISATGTITDASGNTNHHSHP